MSEYDALDQMMSADDAPAWVPELPGDSITGMVITVGERDGDYGRSPFVTVQVNKLTVAGVPDPAATDQLRTVHGFGTVLGGRMRMQLERGMDYGWLCGCVYKGERNGNRATYKDFSFVAKPGAGQAIKAGAPAPSAPKPVAAPLPDEEPF